MYIPDVLQEAADQIRALDVDNQEVPFDRDPWRSQIDGTDLDGVDLGDIFAGIAGKSITRKDIFERSPPDSTTLVPCTGEDVNRWIRFFILVMIWGYGEDRRGPWRVNQMVHTPNLLQIICQAGEECFYGLYPKAYKTLQTINQLGPAYASKLLYFYCRNFNGVVKPLIFDSRVIRTMRSFNWPIWTMDDMANGDNPKKQPHAYGQYLILMQNWADALRCRPEQLEYFMWVQARGEP